MSTAYKRLDKDQAAALQTARKARTVLETLFDADSSEAPQKSVGWVEARGDDTHRLRD